MRRGFLESRALFLIGALLASSARAQEASFDLKSESIRKIVHDTAATQSAPVQFVEARPAERKLVIEIEDAQPLEKPIKIAPPPNIAAPRNNAAPESPGLLSSIIETLVDSALGVDGDDTSQQHVAVRAQTPQPK
jgi:hypothetical protein